MRNFIIDFVIILGACTRFIKNRVNVLPRKYTRKGVAPKFSDLENVARRIRYVTFNFDSANFLFVCIMSVRMLGYGLK